MINFGYKMENGTIKVASDEAIIVAEIFSRYGQGEILKSIADDLTRRRIVYNNDNQTWNKSMIARIIENRRYIGDEGYPGIIAEEDYVRANNLKCQKAIKKATYSPEIEYLKSHLRCAQCGYKMYRHATWSTREKWFCKNGCQNDIYIGVPAIINSEGVRELLMLDLNEEEQAKLDNSCKLIKEMREKSIDKIIEE
jgi:hypothetical protein